MNSLLNKICKSKLLIIILFLELFYGAIILMINYTQTGLGFIVFGDYKHSGEMAYSIIGQAIGSLVAIFGLKFLLSKINIRYLFAVSFISGIIITIILANFNIFQSLPTLSKQVILFFILFDLGVSISPIDPMLSTLIGAVYKGNNRSKNIQYLESIYVFGAGIIPLFASPFILKLNNIGFNEVHDFYYIATGICLAGLILGMFIDFIHDKQLVSARVLKENKDFNHKKIFKRLFFMVLMMGLFIYIETTLNYIFKNISIGPLVKQPELYATIAYGLYLTVQGITLLIYGTFFYKKLKFWQFIIIDCLLIYFGFIAIINNGLTTMAGLFILAIILGIGISNLWAQIYSWAVMIDENRATFIGLTMNFVTYITIIFTDLISGSIWRLGENSTNPILYYLVIIVTMCILLSLMILVLGYYLKTDKQIKCNYK